ncbi:MAG: hypothetical protein VST70_01260 [Nitrospirota bacterium]|nr:hypothetical protein [Nitrospirota bacterium]
MTGDLFKGTTHGPGYGARVLHFFVNTFFLFFLFLVPGCGMTPSNPLTPPEILVTGQSGTSGDGGASPYALPYSGTPLPLLNVPIPPGLSLRGGVVTDNTLIYLAKDSSGKGRFLLSGIPLGSSSIFRQITGLTGTPLAMAQITGQVLVVLATTGSYPQGCLEFFQTTSLVSMTSGGALSPSPSCVPFVGSHTLANGFLLPFSDGVGFMVGQVSLGQSPTTEVSIYSQIALSSLLTGGSMPSPLSTWTLWQSYQSSDPISGATLSGNTVILLPDPSSKAIDIYKVTTLYGSSGGSLVPFSQTTISSSTLPTLLAIDPSSNFCLAGSGSTVSIFGLDSILTPPGTLGPLGTINAGTGEAFGSLVTYTGSS